MSSLASTDASGEMSPQATRPHRVTLSPTPGDRPPDLEPSAQDDALRPLWRRSGGVLAALASLVPAFAAAVLLGSDAFGFACLALWAAMLVARAARAATPHVREQLRSDLRTSMGFCGLVAFAGLTELVTLHQARVAAVVVAVAGLSAFAGRRLQPRAVAARRVVLVGTYQDLEAYVTSGLGEDVIAGCHVIGAGPTRDFQPSLVVPMTSSTLESLPELVQAVQADAVLVLPGAGVSPAVVRELTWQFERTAVTVGVVVPVSSVSAHRLRTSVSDTGTVLEVGLPRGTAFATFAKNVFDRLGALVLLLLTAPLLLLLWAAVRLDSPGPGMFVQTRVGREGKLFRMYKFRSMHRDAEQRLADLVEANESDAVLFKIRKDPRITRVGRWLRRSSLDELPQLFNVLLGDMSLVGPRPALPEEVARYDAVARRRLVVKPGITGLWQVSGRSDLLWEDALRLDLYYADNWRLVDDLAIAFRTLSAVTQARGAY